MDLFYAAYSPRCDTIILTCLVTLKKNHKYVILLPVQRDILPIFFRGRSNYAYYLDIQRVSNPILYRLLHSIRSVQNILGPQTMKYACSNRSFLCVLVYVNFICKPPVVSMCSMFLFMKAAFHMCCFLLLNEAASRYCNTEVHYIGNRFVTFPFSHRKGSSHKSSSQHSHIT